MKHIKLFESFVYGRINEAVAPEALGETGIELFVFTKDGDGHDSGSKKDSPYIIIDRDGGMTFGSYRKFGGSDYHTETAQAVNNSDEKPRIYKKISPVNGDPKNSICLPIKIYVTSECGRFNERNHKLLIWNYRC